jgi:3-phenylpropionate/trans-cinnamate dioxygenase ferredoxin reductase subunit
MSEHLVVVGGGQAAAQAIHTARQSGFDGRITLVGDEPWLPYQRPPLSKKYLAGELARERLHIKSDSFYESREVDLMLGNRAESLDAGQRQLTLSDGSRLAYSKLLLATGSRVRRLELPGSDLEGVHYLRTIADVDAIVAEFAAGRRLVIIGAGYIGLEVAAVATEAGLAVTVLEAGERVMARAVCPLLSDYYADYHASRGVEIVCRAAVSGFVGRNRVDAVTTANGQRYEADLVIVGIGIVPNVELAAAAGLACDNGIRVDPETRTADPAIFAAGDCTSHAHPFVGRPVRLESVHNAIEQGKSAALACVGEPRAFSEVPWFWSDQYDLKLQIAGLSLDYDATAVRGQMDSGEFAVYYLRQGRVIAVDAVNRPKDFIAARRYLAEKPRFDVAAIEDDSTDLAELARMGGAESVERSVEQE